MVIGKRTLVGAITVLSSLHASNSVACGGCTQILTHGTEVSEAFTSETVSLGTTAADVSLAAANAAQAIYTGSTNVVDAIKASSASEEMEFKKSQKLQVDTLDVFRRRLEDLDKTSFVAEVNMDVAKTYGAQNIHSALCRQWANGEVRERAKVAAQNLVVKFREAQKARRESDFKSETMPTAVLDLTAPLGGGSYSEDQAALAVTQIPFITGETTIPVSVDRISSITSESGGNKKLSQELTAVWLRSSQASQVLATDVAKRTEPTLVDNDNPDLQAKSLMGELWREATLGLNKSSIHESSTASEAKLLRGLIAKESVSLKMNFEKLDSSLSENRLLASLLGFEVQDAATKLETELDEIKSGN